MKKITKILIFLSVISVIIMCSREEGDYEYDVEIYFCLPPPYGVNEVVMIKNNDTVEYTKEFAHVLGLGRCNSFRETQIKFDYNYYRIEDNYYYINYKHVLPLERLLFNGTNCYSLSFCSKDTNNYEYITHGELSFKDYDIYSDICKNKIDYFLINNSNNKIIITKYEEIGGLIEGSFNGTFLHKNDTISDTLNINCNFTAIRWDFCGYFY